MPYPGRYPRVEKSSLAPFWAMGGIGPTHAGDVGDVADACGNTPAGIRSTGTLWTPGIAGPSISVPSANGVSFAPSLPTGTTSATWGALVRRYDQTPASAATTGLCDFNPSQNSHFPWVDGHLYVGILDTTSRPITYLPGGGFDFTAWHFLHVISAPGTNGYQLFIDGLLVASATRGTLGLPSTSIMCGTAGGAYGFNGQFSHVFLCDYAVSPIDMAMDVANPNWRYEAGRSRRRAYASPAASNPTPYLSRRRRAS